ncbi:glycosyltransferase family 39 protein [Hymenobacter sp. 15J16-1T3B]|uniref:ArnT family glycosyltransferase n=1 Tax=Hymenobacter sp. 15J16-1T3B TaxID=2886941 RepID=UPI001D1015EC|nr:glycosyltransferase family 39 protein [Hymenobacter sp. 15J16-1T3B]MCC3155994.1 glycosyltransferase family 39 protein [Hymenobacter sp. 15J16-1T3B]
MPTASASLRSAFRSGRWLVPAFFGVVLLLGLLLHRDYGVSWDEPVDRLNGMVNAKYVAEKLAPAVARRQDNYALIPDLATYADQDHGVVFELPSILLQKLLRLEEPQQVYWTRHLLIYLLYTGGLLAFYKLARLRFGDWRLALLGTAVLYCTPRLFADAFYNAKDGLFLAFFTVAMFTLARLLRHPTATRGLWHGVATGVAIALRVNGVLLAPLTILGFVLWLGQRHRGSRGLWEAAGLWVLLSTATTVLCWPFLWEHPWAHFAQAFSNFRQFSRGASTVLYGGGWVSALDLPWHYAPWWLLITTPLAYTAAFGLGAAAWLLRYGRRPLRVLRTYAGTLDVLTGAWLLGPLVAVVVFRSVLYDGWRHLYFIFPAFVLVGLHGVRALWLGRRQWRRPRWRLVAGSFAALLAAGALEPLWRLVRDHPQQQLYFSLLSPATIEAGYEGDYWALTYRQGLQWILDHDSAARITVRSYRPEPVYNNMQVLDPAARQRLVRVPPQGEAEYFITNYRWHPESYADSMGQEVYRLRVNGVRALSVFRRERRP